MQIFGKYLLNVGLLVSTFSVPALAQSIDPTLNRIESGRDNPIRCVPQQGEKCERLRERALRTDCINQQEYDSLVKLTSFPICEYDDNDPAKWLLGWCLCTIPAVD